MELGKEYPDHEEGFWIRRITDRLRAQMEKDYPDSRMLRDAHPKQHACLKAEFTIEPDLPPELAVGLFSKPKTHSAWIRFSNASPDVRSDKKRGIRGLGIQLVDVEGTEGESGLGTQDFLLLSCPVFLTRDVKSFDRFVKAANGSFLSTLLYFFAPLPSRIALLIRIAKNTGYCASLLDTRFWSATPYLFGNRAMKYTVTPRTNDFTSTGFESSPDFLRDRLIEDLKHGDATFHFSVQFQTDPEKMPVEDATVEWREEVAPFRKVATITIPEQNFDNSERNEFGEDLTFNPWHCLPEHRPMGGINRGRREIYSVLSKFRLSRNGVKHPSND